MIHSCLVCVCVCVNGERTCTCACLCACTWRSALLKSRDPHLAGGTKNSTRLNISTPPEIRPVLESYSCHLPW